MATIETIRPGLRAAGAAEVINPDGAGGIVLVCEHADNTIPSEFGGLGLDETALNSHIAWDPGAFEVAMAMSSMLDAPLVAQRVSRLLYDCNRPPEAPSAIPAVSETYQVPGNLDLSAADRRARIERYYEPFRGTLAGVLDRAMQRRLAPAIVTVHTFTPVYGGKPRDVDIGILHDTDSRLADAMLRSMAGKSGFKIRRNDPYGPEDGVTHTLREHALSRGLLNVMLEIRNDLVSNAGGQHEIAGLVAGFITNGLTDCAADAEAPLAARGSLQ